MSRSTQTTGVHRLRRRQPLAILLVLAFLAIGALDSSSAGAEVPSAGKWWSEAGGQALAQAGTNRAELVKALAAAPAPQREGLQFLLENMPRPDLQTLSAALLLENLALAYQAREVVPWGKSLPDEIFLNDVLPYASVNERRDAWRKTLHDICAPLVKDCQTPGEAAQVLNQKLFGLVKVRYSTERRKADQSPLETMESGKATCTGLSILLVDACRAVGVPARVAGTPMWVNLRGNHTWVEVWDEGWHFTGAAEPDPAGLDRGWFGHDASQALRDAPRHAIYASSFKQTGLAFPLVWARAVDWVSAVNVTDRYTAKSKPAVAVQTRLLVKVLDRPGGRRVAAEVQMTDSADAALKFAGTSRDESADLNDLLPFAVAPGRTYEIVVKRGEETVRREFRASTNAQEVIVVHLRDGAGQPTPSHSAHAQPRASSQLQPDQEAQLNQALTDFFTASAEQQSGWRFSRSLEKLLRENEPAVRVVAWEAYRAAPIHEALKRDCEAKQVRFDPHFSPYAVKTVGTRPANGWALFIAMHGGGGAPKEVNDSQWKVMQRYYHDHPEVGGYLYVALRAPNDTWNGFYTDYVYPLVANLIRQFVLFAEVDPNKVFIMGYSHGGYGAFAIGPKMPDRFAAIHASAAAPTDGETTGKTLRNTVFTFMIGEKDTMYGRLDRCRRFDETIRHLRGDRTDIYPVTMEFKAGQPHSGLPDRDKIKDMYAAVRNPVPRELTWEMTDRVIDDFYWLHVPKPASGQEIVALCRDNRVIVAAWNVASASVFLDSRLIDFGQPVTLEVNGRVSTRNLAPSLRTLGQTLLRRGDPELAFAIEIDLALRTTNGRE